MTGIQQIPVEQKDTKGRAKGTWMRHWSVYVWYFIFGTYHAVAATQQGIPEELFGSDTDDDMDQETEKSLLFDELNLIHRLELECLDLDNDESSNDD